MQSIHNLKEVILFWYLKRLKPTKLACTFSFVINDVPL